MRFEAVLDLVKHKQLAPLLKIYMMLTPFYRLGYIAALANNGCFNILKEGPATLDELLSALNIKGDYREELKAWLHLGIRLNELGLENGRYGLSGISKGLANAIGGDALLAMIEEVALLHHNLILKTPAQLRDRGKWTMSDQDGEMIARSSRVLEPLQNEVIDTIYPSGKPIRLLEVGCGSGIYLKRAAEKNPQLEGVGLELQEPVAEMARRHMVEWGLQRQITIESGDIRGKHFSEGFDLVTLYNNIYYFPVGERVALLEHLRGFLKPGGLFVLTTGCQGGSLAMELLNLWGVATRGCDRLPDVDEMVSQMKSAGFVTVNQRNLLPGDAFYVFVGMRGDGE